MPGPSPTTSRCAAAVVHPEAVEGRKQGVEPVSRRSAAAAVVQVECSRASGAPGSARRQVLAPRPRLGAAAGVRSARVGQRPDIGVTRFWTLAGGAAGRRHGLACGRHRSSRLTGITAHLKCRRHAQSVCGASRLAWCWDGAAHYAGRSGLEPSWKRPCRRCTNQCPCAAESMHQRCGGTMDGAKRDDAVQVVQGHATSARGRVRWRVWFSAADSSGVVR